MSEEAAQLMETLLKLPVRDRAEMANRLLLSLDELPNSDAQDMWRDEIVKRARSAMSDDWAGADWADVRERVKPV